MMQLLEQCLFKMCSVEQKHQHYLGAWIEMQIPGPAESEFLEMDGGFNKLSRWVFWMLKFGKYGLKEDFRFLQESEFQLPVSFRMGPRLTFLLLNRC